MRTLTRLDRRLGAALRRPGAVAPRAAARVLGPAFRALVAVMVLRPATRRAGLQALAAAVVAATIARLLRDRVGRRRPGARAEGGFPSRHAAAAAAIARAAGRHHPALGRALCGAAALGLAGRIASGEHEPADVAAGAALGIAVDRALERFRSDGIP